MSLHRILLVEEDAVESARRAIILVTSGYRVATATSADEAADACGSSMPDLVLVGLQERPEKVSAIVAGLRARFRNARIAVLMHKSHHLCAVEIDDVIAIPAELPGDFLNRVGLALEMPAPVYKAKATASAV
jgi:DNA-binding response OmpR family regulator